MAPHSSTLPGKSHGWMSLVNCSPWGCEESDTTERLHFHFSLSCLGEGNGNPLQCSCLENPRDGGACWAAVYGVAQSRTRLKWLSSSSIITEIRKLTLIQHDLIYRSYLNVAHFPINVLFQSRIQPEIPPYIYLSCLLTALAAYWTLSGTVSSEGSSWESSSVFLSSMTLTLLKMKVKVAQSCPTLCDSIDCSPPGSSAHGILQTRILEWEAIPFSRGSSRPTNQARVSCTVGSFFTIWATREALTLLKNITKRCYARQELS